MKNEALSKLSPAIQDAIRVCREDLSEECDIDDGRAFLPFDADRFLVRLVERALEAEYPPHGNLIDAIQSLAACDPEHGTAWCDAMDKVVSEVFAVEAAMRKERTNGDQ